MIKYNNYIIDVITNTHVGAGEQTYGIVDNLIQRDPVSKIPVFHGSSVKGALRDFAKEQGMDKKDFDIIFGTETVKEKDTAANDKNEKTNKKEKESKPGEVKFFSAQTYLLPLRATNKIFYFATSPLALTEYFNSLKTFGNTDKLIDPVIEWIGKLFPNEESIDEQDIEQKDEEKIIDKKDFLVSNFSEGVEIEDYKNGGNFDKKDLKKYKEVLEKYLGIYLPQLAVFNDDVFRDICEQNMPVITRNNVDDKNLFYEEVLPRKTKLLLSLGYDENKQDSFNTLQELITADDSLVSFGGNYSVGYGVCKIKSLTNSIEV